MNEITESDPRHCEQCNRNAMVISELPDMGDAHCTNCSHVVEILSSDHPLWRA